MKGRTGELVKLGFLARHAGISVWVLTQQLSSIAKPFQENVAVGQNHEGHLRRIRGRAFAQRAKKNDCKAEKAQVRPFDFVTAPSISH